MQKECFRGSLCKICSFSFYREIVYEISEFECRGSWKNIV